jgi:hypothetical protein
MSYSFAIKALLLVSLALLLFSLHFFLRSYQQNKIEFAEYGEAIRNQEKSFFSIYVVFFYVVFPGLYALLLYFSQYAYWVLVVFFIRHFIHGLHAFHMNKKLLSGYELSRLDNAYLKFDALCTVFFMLLVFFGAFAK